MTGTSPALPASLAPAGGKRALLIGIDAYESVRSLSGCVNDILEIREFLVRKLGMAATDIQFLASPAANTPLPADISVTATPTRQNIIAAFDRLGQQTGPGDQIVIYYSGHGVRLGQGPGNLIPNPENRNQHISAIAAADTRLNGLNLVLNRELNAAINRLLTAGATVTAVFDACHSGGVATKDLAGTGPDAPAAREIVLDPQKIAWEAFAAQYAAEDLAPAEATRDIGGDGGGWVPGFEQARELIVVSGGRDVELSHEYTPAGTRHGALTYFLLDALRSTGAGQVRSLRWGDIYPCIRGQVNGLFPDQTPTLEGRNERPVFGGTWQPYDPGYTVTTTPGRPSFKINGGIIHGLGPGAQVAIYPPGTADFAAADSQGVARVIAQVDSADLATSQARVINGDASKVVDGARARVIKPSIGTPPLAVALSNMPPALTTAIQGAAGANTFLRFVDSVQEAGVEVCPWTRDGQTGWAILKARVPNTADPIGENDVIAFAPAPSALAEKDARDLGRRFAAGLVQWASYTAVLNRRNDEPQLRGAVRLSLLADTDRAHLLNSWAQPDAPVRAPNAAGQAVVHESERMLLKLNLGSNLPGPLNVAILLCSDEGNIQLLFDSGENPLPSDEERSVGLNGPLNPFRLSTSDWQTASRYSFKVFASDKEHPFDAQALTLEDTVQSLLLGGAKGIAPDQPDALWTTLELPVLVTKG